MVQVVGLTGGIASGKSTVAKILRQQGVKCIDCDALGHATYAPGSDTFAQLVQVFGEDIVAADGSIDRKVLGGKVFGKPSEMDKLTGVVWPGILQLLDRELAACAGENELVFVEAAVLFEAGWETRCQSVWCIVVEPDLAVERLKVRNNWTAEQAQARIKSQWSNAERSAKSSTVIENQGTLEELEQKVLRELVKIRPKL